jgi:N-acetylglutamate synthase-like GNAT family acetyltransferase
MDELTIRVATVADQKPLEALQWRASLNNPGDREALLANPDAIELPLDQIMSSGVFVGERDGKVVGFAAVLSRADGQFELDGLFVEPTIWKSGIGRSLVDHCCEFCRSKGAVILHVIGNPHARDFYLACGFEIVGENRTRFGVGLLMQKMISKAA